MLPSLSRDEWQMTILVKCFQPRKLIGNLALLFSCTVTAQGWLFAACQAALSKGFPRQEYWSGLPFPSPGDLPNPGTELTSPALAGRVFTTEAPGKPRNLVPGISIGGSSVKHSLPNTYQKCRLPEGKQAFCINHVVGINSSGTVSHYQKGTLRTLPKFKCPVAKREPTLQACLSEVAISKPAMFILFCITSRGRSLQTLPFYLTNILPHSPAYQNSRCPQDTRAPSLLPWLQKEQGHPVPKTKASQGQRTGGRLERRIPGCGEGNALPQAGLGAPGKAGLLLNTDGLQLPLPPLLKVLGLLHQLPLQRLSEVSPPIAVPEAPWRPSQACSIQDMWN